MNDFEKELKKRSLLYRSNLSKHQDTFGFIEFEHCDSTLFSGLLGCHKFVDVNLIAARNQKTKQWFRRPLEYDECWASGKSRSTISRDMLLGVMAWSFFNNRSDVLQDIYRYAKRNFWRMGQGRYHGADTLMNPDYMSLLARLIYKMTGVSHWIRYWPLSVDQHASGYQAHLQCVYLILAFQANGYLNGDQLSAIEKMYNADQTNLLKTILYYKTFGHDIVLDFNWHHYPSSRNPSSRDRSEPWAIQRSEGDQGLKPSPNCRIHSGGDLIFCEFVYDLEI